jgi:hypothetical protein
MRLTFGNPLPVEVRHLLNEIMILKQDRAVGPDGERELIAGDWNPGIVCRRFLAVVRHGSRASIAFAHKGGNLARALFPREQSDVGRNKAPLLIVAQFEGDMMEQASPVSSPDHSAAVS